MAESRFKLVDTEPQIFNINDTSSVTPPAEIAGFTDMPHGKFTGQETQFAALGIKQLGSGHSILVARGDPRPIEELKHGIDPKAPAGITDIHAHRSDNSRSACVSFTFAIRTAIAFGYSGTFNKYYGSTPVEGDGRFTVLAAQFEGGKDDVAGPSAPGTLHAGEKEATVPGRVPPRHIVAYRRCVAIPKSATAHCSDIYVRQELNHNDQKRAIEFLKGKPPVMPLAKPPIYPTVSTIAATLAHFLPKYIRFSKATFYQPPSIHKATSPVTPLARVMQVLAKPKK